VTADHTIGSHHEVSYMTNMKDLHSLVCVEKAAAL
jgi:hypothetical protein